MQGIYIIRCLQEQRVYIGSSTNINRRWSEHKRRLNSMTHHCTELQLAWDAYGDESFTFQILEQTQHLIRQEQYWLDKYTLICYNTSLVASNPMANPETVKKQQESLKVSGKHYSPFKHNNPNKPLQEYQVKEIVSKLTTHSVKEIAEMHNVSTSIVYSIAHGAKYSSITGITYTPKKLTAEAVLEIVELRKDHSVSTISTLLGVPERTIYNILSGDSHSEITSIVKKEIAPRKLTVEDVICIKQTIRDTQATNKELADYYNCSISTISAIRLGNRWSSIEVEGFIPGKNIKSTDVTETIIKLKQQGLSHKQIALALGLKSTSSVAYALSKV